jgi:uncharacterized protein DUF6883
LPRAAEAVGVRRKLAGYSLAIEHESGGPKAYLFQQLLGITLADLDHLVAEIEGGILGEPVTRVWEIPYGQRCQVLIPVRGVGIHHGRVMVVTTGWLLRYVGDYPRLVTAYIKGKRASA